MSLYTNACLHHDLLWNIHNHGGEYEFGEALSHWICITSFHLGVSFDVLASLTVFHLVATSTYLTCRAHVYGSSKAWGDIQNHAISHMGFHKLIVVAPKGFHLTLWRDQAPSLFCQVQKFSSLADIHFTLLAWTSKSAWLITKLRSKLKWLMVDFNSCK
jgi:hypothetical protein